MFKCGQICPWNYYDIGCKKPNDEICPKSNIATKERQQTNTDVVVVVRCKDCKHFDEYTKKCYVFCHDCIEVQLEVDGDHFCSYGERKDDG